MLKARASGHLWYHSGKHLWRWRGTLGAPVWPSLLGGGIFQQSRPPSSATWPEWSWKAGLTMMWCSRPGRRARKCSTSARSKRVSPGTVAASRLRSSAGVCASQGLSDSSDQRTRHEYPAGCAGRTPPRTPRVGSARRSPICGSRPGWRGSVIAFQRVGRTCVPNGAPMAAWPATWLWLALVRGWPMPRLEGPRP